MLVLATVGMTMQRTAPFAVRYWDDVVCGLGTTVASVVAVFVHRVPQTLR